MKVYLIPGLAADERVFRHIQLPQNFEPVYLKWLRPETGDTLSRYALRMAQQINTGEPFSLIGLSLGGMIAIEISRQFEARQVILISSIPSSEHLPRYYKWAGRLHLHRIIPINMIKKAALLKRYFTKESAPDKEMLRSMIRDSDAQFIRWALDAVLSWKNKTVPRNLLHLHGTTDAILPMWYTKPTHTIRGAGHLMVMTRAGEINRILAEVMG